jgi:hypothetical protein
MDMPAKIQKPLMMGMDVKLSGVEVVAKYNPSHIKRNNTYETESFLHHLVHPTDRQHFTL